MSALFAAGHFCAMAAVRGTPSGVPGFVSIYPGRGDPNVFKNTSGGPGIETLLPALWTGCEEHGISPTMVVKQLCEGPAKAFLLADKGRLAAGADADIVVLEPGRFIFDPSKSLSAVRWSSFEGREFTVRVAATFVRGTLAWDGSTIRNAAGDGRFLRPSP